MRLWERLLTGLTGLLLVAGLFIVGGSLLGRPLLLAAVPTGSMRPALQPGDLIPVLPVWATGPLRDGEIVVYRQPDGDRWIVHRIIGGDPILGFTTKGDANDTPDEKPVLPAYIAGVVPQSGGKPWRLPHLGQLSSSNQWLANPFTALVAGAAGGALLLGGERKRKVRRRRGEERALTLYAALVFTAFLATLLPAWALSSRVSLQYKVVTERPANIQAAGVYLVGEVHQEEILIQNPSLIPMIVLYQPDDPAIQFDRAWRLIPPGGEDRFHVRVAQDQPGTYQSSLIVGVFVPLLPPQLLLLLSRLGLGITAVILALVPAGLVTAIALLDPQVRLALRGLRNRLLLAYPSTEGFL
jgi:signal peptidase I